MKRLNLIVLGTAGSGKSTLVASFSRWLEQNTELKIARANLDPGCDFIPFSPDFDLREHFTIAKLMREENLGPNGAMVRASELLAQKAPELAQGLDRLPADVLLVDTPGQMEVFLFHGGPEIVKLLRGTTISLFLTDAKVASRAAGLAFTQLLGLSISLRLATPTINVLNKVDLAEGELAELDRALADPELLNRKVLEESSGVTIDLILGLMKLLPELMPPSRLVKVSALTSEGLPQLYDAVHETFCACGDLT